MQETLPENGKLLYKRNHCLKELPLTYVITLKSHVSKNFQFFSTKTMNFKYDKNCIKNHLNVFISILQVRYYRIVEENLGVSNVTRFNICLLLIQTICMIVRPFVPLNFLLLVFAILISLIIILNSFKSMEITQIRHQQPFLQ